MLRKTFDDFTLFSNLIILIFGEVLSRGVYAIALIYLARVLQPGMYGNLELAITITLFLTVFIDLGFGPLGTRNIAQNPADAARLVSQIVNMQFLAGVFVFIMVLSAASLLRLEHNFAILLIGYGATLFSYPFNLNWAFQARNQMIWIAIPQSIRQLVFALAVFWLIRIPGHILRTPAIEMAAAFVFVVLNIWLYQRLDGKIKFHILRGLNGSLFLQALPIGASQMIWVTRMYLPTILLGVMAGVTAVGFYAAAHRIIMALQALLAVYFNNFFPTLSVASGSQDNKLAQILNSSLRVVVWPSLIFACATTLLAPLLINWFFGSSYTRGGTVEIFMILVWTLPVLVWRGHGRSALIALNKQNEELWCSFAGVVLLIIILGPLIWKYGTVGASWALLVSEFTAMILTWLKLEKHLPSGRFMQVFFKLPSLAFLYDKPGSRS